LQTGGASVARILNGFPGGKKKKKKCSATTAEPLATDIYRRCEGRGDKSTIEPT